MTSKTKKCYLDFYFFRINFELSDFYGIIYQFLIILFRLFIKIRLTFYYKKYKIIPIGSYCLPRCICTFNNLKPKKRKGELSCPFDLGFFYDTDAVTRLIGNRFDKFYEGLTYDEEKKYYVNNNINAVFNHDKKLTKSEFIKRYNNRIKNFYTYAENPHIKKIFLMTASKINEVQTDNLINSINSLNVVNYKIVIINESEDKFFYNGKSKLVRVINNSNYFKDFQKINENGNWAGELRKCRTLESFRINSLISHDILKIIFENNKSHKKTAVTGIEPVSTE